MVTQMAGDRLWIYTSIAGAIIGAAFLAYFKDTRASIWCYSKFDQFLDFLVERYGFNWLRQDDDVWRKRYPKMTTKIDELEARIAKLETKKK